MKPLRISLLFICFLTVMPLIAQVPNAFKYQTVVRDAQGNPIGNQDMRIRFDLLEGASETWIYGEVHTVHTSEIGLIHVNIGEGESSYNFSDIDWSNGLFKQLKVSIDTSGYGGFIEMGTAPFLTVPYAKYAEHSGNSSNQLWQDANNGIAYSGNVAIGSDNPDENAILDLETTEKGFLPPRMTESQRDAIDNPPLGLMIFNTTTQCINLFKNNTWYEFCGTCMSPPQPSVSCQNPACEGTSVQLFANNTGGAEPHWTGPNGFTSNEQNPIIYNASAQNEGYYVLFTINDCGSSEPDSVLMELISLPENAQSITGATDVCQTDTDVIYTTPEMPNATTYDWILPDGVQIISGEFTHEVGLYYTDEAVSGNILVKAGNECGYSAASPALYVHVNPFPDVADAGSDQLNLPGTSTTLSANAPTNGTGSWSIVNGFGGMLDDSNDPNTNFTGDAGASYTLQWEISNTCGSNTDVVEISFAAEFVCGDNLIDPRDGKVYATVEIGGQCWMAENLNIGTQITGGTAQTDNGTIEKYCYNNEASNCDTYGALYQWSEMMQLPDSCQTASCAASVATEHQGICPPGWHVPTDEEFKALEIELGMTAAEADMLNTWRGDPVGEMMKEGGSSGFEALLSGRCSSTGAFSLLGSYEYPYTADEYGTNYAYRRCLRSSSNDVGRWNTFSKSTAFSLRCVKNN